MTDNTFLHGVELIELSDGARTITTPSSSVIGIVGPAQYADADLFPIDTPVLVTNPSQAAGLIATMGDGDEPGELWTAVNDVFSVTRTPMVVVRADYSAVTATQLADVVGEAASYQGAYALLHAQAVLGVRPKILIAPGFTHQQPLDADHGNAKLANPVVTALKAVAVKLRAVVVADGPNDTDAAAIAKAALEADQRVWPLDPWGKFYDASGAVVARPASALAAAVIALNDQTNGYWWSPSNQPLPVVIGTGRPVEFSTSDPTASSNMLNGGGVATIVNAGGFRLWGNRTGATDPNWVFLSVRRTADIVYDAIEAAFLWAMDRPFSKQSLVDIENGGNAFLRGLKAKGAILGGKVWLDPDLNTAESLAAGQRYFDFDFEPPSPAERITFRASRNDAYYTAIADAVVREAQAAA